MKILPMLLGLCALGAATMLVQDDAGECVRPDLDAVARWQDHYATVIEELRARQPEGLDAAQWEKRAEMIDALAVYRESTELFPVNTTDATRRLPGFEDSAGRHCAVAHLMDVSGAEELLATFVRESPHAYIMDLRDDARLHGWAEGVGLTMLEAARIHAPLLPPKPASGSSSSASAGKTVAVSQPAAGTSSKAGTGGAASKRSRGKAGAPKASTTTSPAGHPNSTRGSARTGNVRGRSGTTLGDGAGGGPITGLAESAWWQWWELNKARFLRPSRLLEEQDVAASSGRYAIIPRLPPGVAQSHRREVLALVEKDLDHDDEKVRGSAAMSYGRLAGGTAVADLTELLGDSSVFVRHCALLGLGATGSPAAATVLLEVATTGRARGETGMLSAYGRSLAVVGLGIGRRHGMPASVDGFVEDVLAGMAGDEHQEIGAAAFIYDRLSPSSAFILPAQAALQDTDLDDAMRCRAAQALVQHGDPALGASLVRALAGDSLEVRRAAALALGAMPDEHVLQRLLTAYELESDALTRGFSLIAIGEQATEQARDYLMLQLSHGKNADRPWAALGLGVLARETRDDVARAALRAGVKRESNADARGAYVLASGIARDPLAFDDLQERLVESADPRHRMFAALSLAMLETDTARPVLLERLSEESWPAARAAVAQAVGLLGHPEDAGLLVAEIRDLRDPMLRNQLTVAAWFHGSSEMVAGLVGLLKDRSVKGEARAAALDSLALLIDGQTGMLLAEVSADSNFEAFPDWVNTVLGTFVL